jgi:hypothetical protein
LEYLRIGGMTLREFESEKDFTQILADLYQRLALISIVSLWGMRLSLHLERH